MDTIELADGGLLLYEEVFLPADLAERYFVELRDTAPWEQKEAAFGRLQPRTAGTALPSDPHCTPGMNQLRKFKLGNRINHQYL